MKLSLRSTIVIWYTVWMLLLLSSILALAAAAGDILLIRNAERELAEAIYDAAGDIQEDGFSDLDFLDDGIFLSVYSEDGTLLFGRDVVPRAAKSLQDSTAVSISYDGRNWYVMDAGIRTAESGKLWIRAAIEFAGIAELFGKNWYIFIIILPLIILLAAAGGHIIVSRSLKPLDEMASTAGVIAKGDDLERRVGSKSSAKEIAELATAFNQMLSRLDEAFKRERQFTSDASHELRTPIAVIKAESEYALENRADTEEALIAIRDAADRMEKMVGQLLALTRLEAKEKTIEKTEVDLSKLGRMTLEVLEDDAAQRHIALLADIEDNAAVNGDETLLMRLLINLIRNAITYGKEGGFAKLTIRSSEGKATVIIEDDGIGIAEKDIPHIWDRFYQADSSHSSSGSGLGLSMAKLITALHDGQISVESEEGKGSIFTLVIPR